MQEKRKGSLFIVSAPSGAGKTTLCKEVVLSLPGLKESVSYTTRPPRRGEVNGRDYIFITRDEFRAMVERGEFVEWAEVHGELYGTSKKRLEELMSSGNDVIMDIDVQGAMQLKEKYREGIYIFVLPPSMEALEERLRARMANSEEEIEERLRRAVEEMKYYYKYDYVIINNVLKNALKELEAIIISNRVRTVRIDSLWIEERFLR